MSLRYVDIGEVYLIHQLVINRAGTKASVRDFGLLHSAVERPKSTFGGRDLSPFAEHRMRKLADECEACSASEGFCSRPACPPVRWINRQASEAFGRRYPGRKPVGASYPSIFLKAAALLQSLTLNHPFTDGNKRTAWTATHKFLWDNGYHLKAKQDEAVEFMLAVDNEKLELGALSKWLKRHSRERKI